MSVNLTSYQSVKTSIFVRIDVDEYRTSPSGSYTSEILTFSDHDTAFTIDSQTYTPLGALLNVSTSSSELRPSSNTVTLTLSAIPESAITEMMYSKIKGAPVKIYRAYFNATTGVQIGTTVGRFIGSVNNISFDEEYDVLTRTASNTLQIECASNVDVLSRKVSGRRTNPDSMKSFYPSDTSFDRVPNLKDSTFNFGAP